MKQTHGKLEWTYKGKRYWMNLERFQGRFRWHFYSSHKWPFFAGSFLQDNLNYQEAIDQFMTWLPFNAKPAA